MMPQLVPQTFIMDQQLELPSSWYGDGSGKQGLGGGRVVVGGLGLELASSLNPDELFTCLGAVPNEWGLQEESFMVEPEPFESPAETASGTLFTLEDYDDALASLVPSGSDLPESFIRQPSRVAADGAHGNLLGPDDKCGDGWAAIGPSSRRSDRICDRSFEDVFQVDTQDLLCSPTLAQLNSEQDGCSDLLDDIANVIVKDEYAMVSEEAASGSASAQPCGLQASPLSSSRTDRIEHVPSVAAFGFGCAPVLSVEAPSVSLGRFATSPGNASVRADRRASVPAGGVLPAASSSTAAVAVAHAKAVRPPEKRRRLSDSVTLYDLLISKSSPQQLQVLMNRRSEGGLMLSRGMAERHEAAGQQLQHKKPRHGTVAASSAAAANANAVSSGVTVSDSRSLFVDNCGDYRVGPSATAKTVVHEPRRRTPLPAASLTRVRQSSECSTVSTFDEGLDEEDGCGYTSDADSCSSCSTWTSKDGKQRQHRPQRQQRHSPYFWQYNSQSKGPRGERFELTLAPSDDPHKPVNFTDPVFDPEQHVRIRHVGRARKGDGNDVRPNPRRLVSIGKELAKLNRLMNDVTAPAAGSGASLVGAAESGSAGRPDSKREKNKLASRACRLKKKAQHEANKVKLCGLEQERKELMTVLDSLKIELQKHRVGLSPQDAKTSNSELCPIIGVEPSFSAILRELTSRHLVTKVAGRTSQFVSEVVAQVEAGDPLGGLVVTED